MKMLEMLRKANENYALNLVGTIVCSVAFGIALVDGNVSWALLDIIMIAFNAYFVQKHLTK